jgi:hypothetical protein
MPKASKRKRVLWSDAEAKALSDGVETVGEGNWVAIKAAFPVALANRSPCQIKDRWRNVKIKRKELDLQKRRRIESAAIDIFKAYHSDGYYQFRQMVNEDTCRTMLRGIDLIVFDVHYMQHL